MSQKTVKTVTNKFLNKQNRTVKVDVLYAHEISENK